MASIQAVPIVQTMQDVQNVRTAAAVLAVLVLLAASRAPVRYFRLCAFPWTYVALFGVALFAAFIATLVAAAPVLAWLTATLATLTSHAAGPDGMLSGFARALPQAGSAGALLLRFALFTPVCGLISLCALGLLSRTRFLSFLPHRLLAHAALMVTACLFLFALSGA